VFVSPAGVTYFRAVRAFRGLDTPPDELLLGLLNEMLEARAAEA